MENNNTHYAPLALLGIASIAAVVITVREIQSWGTVADWSARQPPRPPPMSAKERRRNVRQVVPSFKRTRQGWVRS